MNTVVLDADIRIWVIVWFVAAMYLLIRYWRLGKGVGLMLTYVVSFGSLHWLAALLYLLPWYSAPGEQLVAEGMKYSAIAMVAFAVGAELASRRQVFRERTIATAAQRVLATIGGELTDELRLSPLAASWYLAAGLLLYGIVAPFASGMPTLVALVNTGSAVIIVAIALKCWNAWQTGNWPRVWSWLAAASVMPLVTIATQGFLGYGMAVTITIYAFAAAFYGPRWKAIVASVLIGYLGLSVYVTYMRDRGDIRATVWSGSRLNDRVQKVKDSLTNFEWFDVHNVDHLDRIDGRMNQDWLVGAAAANLQRGGASYAYGTTLRDAVLAVVPRALWPDKPMAAGSGDLVERYTGIHFMEGTSVGIGQVMEMFVNFDGWGITAGFFLIGYLMATVDRRSYFALIRGEIGHFVIWYLPGLSLLNLGGSFVEVTASAGAALAMAVVLNKLVRRRLQDEAATRERLIAESAGTMEALR